MGDPDSAFERAGLQYPVLSGRPLNVEVSYVVSFSGKLYPSRLISFSDFDSAKDRKTEEKGERKEKKREEERRGEEEERREEK